MSDLLVKLKPCRIWLLLGLTLLFVGFVRVRLRDMPLERDEGEYAYAGQLILQGVPPYKEAYNMKLPGTYAAYALIEAIFGQSTSGIHIGVMCVNLGSILLMFFLGRKLLDEVAGLTAAVSFAFLSLSPGVLGLAGHATHFVVLFAVAGLLVLLYTVDLRVKPKYLRSGQPLPPALNRAYAGLKAPRQALLIAGLLLGLGFLMKQHGVFFCLLGPLFLLFCRINETLRARALARDPYGIEAQHHPRPWRPWGRSKKKGAGKPSSTVPLSRPTLLAASAVPRKPWIAAQRAVGSEGIAPSPLTESRNEALPEATPKEKALDTPAPASPQASAASSNEGSATGVDDEGLASLEPRASDPAPNPAIPPVPWLGIVLDLCALAAGIALPYLLTCLLLWKAGVFHQFVFWTVSYAAKYVSAVSFSEAQTLLRVMVRVVIGPEITFWLLALAGGLMLWWEERLSVASRVFLVALLLCSMASASVGFYFREHYFILVLPVLALFGGLAISRAVRLLQHDTTIELPLAIPLLVLFGASVATSTIGHSTVWFNSSGRQAVEDIYGTTLFSEALNAAEYVKSNTPPQARIAVLGSEPEIYFYANRRSATGYIYTYPLVEHQPYARIMQNEMTSEIEKAKPEYMIYIGDPLSWMPKPNADLSIYDWFKSYWGKNLDLEKTVNITGPKELEAYAAGHNGQIADNVSAVLILKQRPSSQ